MKIYLAGAEVPSHRKLLAEAKAPRVAMSFLGLRRRVKFARPWVLDAKMYPEANVFVDSGAYTINSGIYSGLNEDTVGSRYSQADLKNMAAAYRDFVVMNLDRMEFASEFDILALGRDWIEAQREIWWDHVPRDKMLVIWHPDWGIETLQEMCATYARVGVPQVALGGRNLIPLLNNLVHTHGVKLHGVAMTKVDEMSAVAWDSVSSTSWISPQRFGDTIVWTGRELKRYPKAYKEQARKRHRTLFEREGFDSVKIENGEPSELLRVSIWSWRQLEDHINHHGGQPLTDSDFPLNFRAESDPVRDQRKHPRDSDDADQGEQDTGESRDSGREQSRDNVRALVQAAQGDKQVTTPGNRDTDPDDASGTGTVVAGSPETGSPGTTTLPVVARRDTSPLPVMGVGTRRSKTVNEHGVEEEVEFEVVGVRSDSTRVCNACFLSAKCPAFEPGSNCAYDIPIQITSRDQFKALQNSLIEMQTQRVMFMRFAEELEGGYSDPNLSAEIDRLRKMMKDKNEMDEGSFSLRIDAKGAGGGPGMLERLFGSEASERARALPEPVPADHAIEQFYPDAEIVKG